jgi:hypothetical protein
MVRHQGAVFEARRFLESEQHGRNDEQRRDQKTDVPPGMTAVTVSMMKCITLSELLVLSRQVSADSEAGVLVGMVGYDGLGWRKPRAIATSHALAGTVTDV